MLTEGDVSPSGHVPTRNKKDGEINQPEAVIPSNQAANSYIPSPWLPSHMASPWESKHAFVTSTAQ